VRGPMVWNSLHDDLCTAGLCLLQTGCANLAILWVLVYIVHKRLLQQLHYINRRLLYHTIPFASDTCLDSVTLLMTVDLISETDCVNLNLRLCMLYPVYVFL